MTPHVLVAFGSKRGGTAEIANAIGESLRMEGLEVTCCRASSVRDLDPYDAVVIGSALYTGRWIHEARRFVTRHTAALRVRPVWMFSSGPLDASASEHDLPPPPRVAALVARVHARGHVIFGGRLAGDWERIEIWAHSVAHELARLPPRARDVHQPAA